MPKTPIKKSSYEKTEITGGRVKIVTQNMDLPNEKLSEMTDGLSEPVIGIIKHVEREGLRGNQGR
ncbi:hypothetical protein KGY79_13925 [Candidatus Bipolaricaulota bacterium]|nr:hypothetical protein [Candidatus Bipolaricaulota bacterium]